MAAIDVIAVGKVYGRQKVIEKLDLAIPDGSFAVILGPSGCGKSTLLRMIAGLEAISFGEIRIDGRRVNDLEPRERGCAMVFQNYALYPHMSVAQNMEYALKVEGVPRADRMKRVQAVAKTLGLTDYLDRLPAALSGGQRQRVAMGRAMIREPRVFLFDEPLSNLDAKLRVQMRLEIRRLHRRLAATSVFVTHDQVEAMTLADLLIVMNAGHVEQVGTPSDIYRAPASRFVAEFIGSPPMNILRGGKVTADGVSFGSGASLPLPPAGARPLPASSPVDVGFRPEHTVVSDGCEGLPFMPDITEDLGAAHLIHGRVLDWPVVVSVPSSDNRLPDVACRLRVPEEALHYYCSETGARID